MGANLWSIRVYFGTKITKHDEILGFSGVFENDPAPRGSLAAEDFIIGHLAKTDQLGAIQPEIIHLTAALNHDKAVSTIISDSAFDSRPDRKLLCGEVLLPIDPAVDNPPGPCSLQPACQQPVLLQGNGAP